MQTALTLATSRQSEVKTAFEAPQWYFNRLNYRVRVRADIMREFASGYQFSSILDVGCGDGSISIPLLAKRCRLTLQDISDAMLQIAAERIPEESASEVQFVGGDFMQARLEPSSFDLIICLGVLAYVDIAQPFISRLVSLLKPGGRIIIEFTDAPHFLSRMVRGYCAITGLIRPQEVPLVKHSHREVADLCAQAGIDRVASYRHATPLPLIRNFFSHNFHYRVTKVLHGSLSRNRLAWLGNECIYCFRKSQD